MIFSVEQVRAIRQGKKSATLLPVTARLRPGSVRILRRRVSLEEEGGSTSTVVETVTDPRPEPGAREPVLITVLAVRDLELEQLTFAEARACGYRTVAGVRDAWLREHPRSPLARLVRFALGDLRNTPRLLAPTGAGFDYTGDPHRAMPDEPEALSAAELARIAAVNGQSYLRHRAEQEIELRAKPVAQRIERIQQASARMHIDVRREMRVIEQRIARAERRAKLSDSE